jgi:Flp pilus assembly protein TadD
MDRFQLSRKSHPDFGPRLALFATAAMASVALTGCSTGSAPRADVSVNKAQVALQKGETGAAITHAEAAVLANPRDPGFRALLGTAYLEAGRFQSAAQSFEDALALGEGDPRTVLSYALSKTAVGEQQAALAKLGEWENSLDPADAGLALALAGDAQRGVFLLTNAVRGGMNTAKVRQNLAYTYALAGNWRAARVMMAEDVPADQIDARLSDWAAKSRPEDYALRVADLLKVTPARDAGVPATLALANFPSSEQLMAEAMAQGTISEAPVQVAMADEPGKPTQAEAMAFDRGSSGLSAAQPVEKVDPTVAAILRATGSTPAASPAGQAPRPAAEPRRISAAQGRMASNAASSGARFVSRPMVQEASAAPERSAPQRVATLSAPAPAPAPAAKPAPARVASAVPKGDSHLIQLGSYTSRDEAERGWVELKRKFPQLADHDVVITKAEVKGRIYFRVAAAGFGQVGARQMCGTVKSAGGGCFAYGKNNPPAGAIDKGTRIAAR